MSRQVSRFPLRYYNKMALLPGQLEKFSLGQVMSREHLEKAENAAGALGLRLDVIRSANRRLATSARRKSQSTEILFMRFLGLE